MPKKVEPRGDSGLCCFCWDFEGVLGKVGVRMWFFDGENVVGCVVMWCLTDISLALKDAPALVQISVEKRILSFRA
jgi:hypothetical protein